MGDRSRDRSDAELARSALGWSAGVLVGFLAIVALLGAWLGSCEFDWAGTGEFGPGKGVASERLPVEVSPRTGLVDGTVVTVSSEAFEPHEIVGVAVCLEAADTESAGVDACDEIIGARYAVTPEGKLSATYAVPRVVTIAGEPHDCAAPGTSCLVVAADVSDYDRSGGQRISYRTDLGPTDLVARTTRPNSDLLPVLPPSFDDLAAGEVVEVTASGFQPGEPILLAHCADFPAGSAISSCDPVDDEAMGAVLGRSVHGVSRHADATGTARFSFTTLEAIDPFGGTDEGVDCAEPSTACSFVISSAADTKRSAVVPYTIAR